ncbi:Pentafunctional AroM protein [Atractiella rhizophila]|nr:Pentafunctional AroM protein [Atractiella rhizophila]
MTTISFIDILSKTQCIRVGRDLQTHIIETLLELKTSRYVLITDTNLEGYVSLFQLPNLLVFRIPPGENSKCRRQKEEIENWMLQNGCTRDVVIIALGGGVVGDLVGFVAATFMRGARFVQVPTTLLAMVDSSIGGKTAVDTPHGKNLIGSFWQPEYIFIDIKFLQTLPKRELINGLAEVIKTAAIRDAAQFINLESNVSEILSITTGASNQSSPQVVPTALLTAIESSIAIKSHIVTKDERETGLRNLVNFGHTIGHAIEAVLAPEMLHGECVSIGMVLEAQVSRAMGILSSGAVGRLERCLKAYGLPISLDDPRVKQALKMRGAVLAGQKLLDIMKLDKKNSGNHKKIVLLSAIGETYEERATVVPDDVILRILSPSVFLTPTGPPKEPIVMSTPGSKSISNRALLLAALGSGECRLQNLLASQDTAVMMDGLSAMGGATFRWEKTECGEDVLIVSGGGGMLQAPAQGKEIYLGNAGTAARFLTSVASLIASGEASTTRTVLTGNARMKQRPIGPLVESLKANGGDIQFLESPGCLPLSIGTTGLRGGKIELAASISSQYVSSILMAAPYAKEEITLELSGGSVISQPYIDMTIAIMATFGVIVEREKSESGELLNSYRIPLGSYRNPPTYAIESDASSATYPLAIAAITGSTCTLNNIGSDSMQGDARFAKDVLEPMGCKVLQTSHSTTVTGPPIGKLKALATIDMELMTDAFLTAAVLAAVANESLPSSRGDTQVPTSTRITGIANQRVKECNRILAMKTELAKFGVISNELPDGIEIIGQSPQSLLAGQSVFCYDDHRVAMAFSVLACARTELQVRIEEKDCVSKTWPGWWDDLGTRFQVKVAGAERNPTSVENGPHARETTYDPDASVVLIGMRGAGKTTVGRLGAAALRRPFVDADQYFEDKLMNVREFVKLHGWKEFRVQEVRLLKECLSIMGKGHVISLGGGVVESEEARRILINYATRFGPVVHVRRDIGEIIDFLNSETHRPSLGEPLRDIWERRKPWLENCSTCDVISYVGGKTIPSSVASVSPQQLIDAEGLPVNLTEIQSNAGKVISKGGVDYITNFFRHLVGDKSEAVDLTKKNSSFIALTFPAYSKDYNDAPSSDTLHEVTIGVDAVELRVDLLSPSGKSPTTPHIPPLDFVATQLAALRYSVPLPIVYTVRTHSQGGMFPDDAMAEYFDLLKLGRRLGCEFIDMEVRWSEHVMQEFVAAKGYSRIIGSWHDWTGNLKWDSREVRERFLRISEYGDIVKIVSKATDASDNIEMLNFRSWAAARSPKPLISLNMGLEGQLSRILCPCFTIVTHPLLPNKAAPGQLTFLEVQKGLELAGEIPKKRFYLFGNPIKQSKSPLIHNTGFQRLGLPHVYGLHECDTVHGEVGSLIRQPDFGGASVTIPHKVSIIPLLDEVTGHAKTIGAVNTIIPVHSRSGTKLLGDNTDWLGIVTLIEASILPGHCISPSCTALVIGAGGTSRAAIYALHQYGFKHIYLFNRTLQHGISVSNSFDKSYNIVPLDSLTRFPNGPPAVIISTVPASAQTTERSRSTLTEGIVIPLSIFDREQGGVVIDMAYRPFITPLLDLIKTASGLWVPGSGIEILLEQGFKQFRCWTGKHPPKHAIRQAVLQEYHLEERTFVN